ncbi:MAG: LapA family protein [Betaproteobacteria bacterium]|nr:LapA family protein [Betaproteobacteria bacterium]
MKRLLRLLQWLLKAAVFFTLFAFALNNQQDTRVHFFFGTFWQAPTVLVVLSSFAFGVAVGVLGMVPRWWRQRQAAQQANAPMPPNTPMPEPEKPGGA